MNEEKTTYQHKKDVKIVTLSHIHTTYKLSDHELAGIDTDLCCTNDNCTGIAVIRLAESERKIENECFILFLCHYLLFKVKA